MAPSDNAATPDPRHRGWWRRTTKLPAPSKVRDTIEVPNRSKVRDTIEVPAPPTSAEIIRF